MRLLTLRASLRGSLSVLFLMGWGGAAMAQPQNIVVTPPSIDFGEIALGDAVSTTLTVTNTGGLPLLIQSVTATGSPAFEFQSPGSFPIPAGQFWLLQITFRPPDDGPFAGTLRIRSNDPDRPLVAVQLRGAGLREEPRLRIVPSRLDFGVVTLGERGTGTLELRNIGDAPLEVSSLRAMPANAYSVGPLAGITIAAGGAVPVEVEFAPPAANAFEGYLEVASNDPQNPLARAPLTGTGMVPPLDFTVEFQPPVIRAAPGRPVPVVLRLYERAGRELVVESRSMSLRLPDGRVLSLGRRLTARLPAGGMVELRDTVLLPEAYYEAGRGDFEENTAPEGLRRALCRAAGLPDFRALKAALQDAQAGAYTCFAELIESAARSVTNDEENDGKETNR